MLEKKVRILGSGIELEGLFAKASSNKAVVITHPHPLYGGDMHNNVVAAIADAYQQAGYSTLRFNFRGVGSSGGHYDEGRGEQEDIKSAMSYVTEQGGEGLHLAGYSFGVWVGAKGLHHYTEMVSFVMVSPPVAFLDFSFLGYDPRINLIITGERDEIAPVATIRKMKEKWNPEAYFHVVGETDHFYWGREQEVTKTIKKYLGTIG